MALKDRLATLKPEESDAYLAHLWKTFKGSEQHEALDLAIQELIAKSQGVVLSPTVTEGQRTFAAGMLAAAKSLAGFIQAAVDFVPAPDAYTDPSPTDDAEEPDPSQPLDVVY